MKKFFHNGCSVAFVRIVGFGTKTDGGVNA